MPRWAKMTIGLAAALFAGWLHHGPFGGGKRLIDALETRAQLRLRAVPGPDVTVRMQREPLARIAVLSGEADSFQKNGLNDYPGINQRIETIPGMAGIRWQGEGR